MTQGQLGGDAVAFKNSWSGLKVAFRNDRNVRILVAALLAAVPLSLVVGFSPLVSAALICVVVLALAVELLNTAIEELADHVTPEHNPDIKRTKDFASAAVFLTRLLAAFVWGATLVERAVFGIW
ncbi:diacylglycerol kinase [Chelatococcus daeguensis]|nr:diacylglycerol kinase [Chelatococcus daeguensis]